jgi:hypothetical protein
MATYSNSSPKPLEVPVRRACLPSTLSIVEYLRRSSFSVNRLKGDKRNITPTTQMQSYNIPMKGPIPAVSGLPVEARVEHMYRPNEVWYKNRHEENIDEDKHEAKERDHIRSEP